MADEIKPPVSGSTTPAPSSSSPSGLTSLKPSGSSPLTPDIKIPPNLPTGEVKPPVFPKPSMPSSSFQASQPLKPPPLSPPPVSRPPLMPFAPATGVRPPIPPPLTSQPRQSPTVFKSSIRTMQDDLAALKKGETPAGFKIEKESEKEIKPIPETAGPKITPPPSPTSHVELGKLEKAKSLPNAPTPPPLTMPKVPPLTAPSLGSAKPTISIPSAGGFFNRFKGRPDFKRIILYAIVGTAGFIITAYLIPYFTSLPTASVSPTPSATLTGTPAALPVSIESLFSIVDVVGISLGPDFTTRFFDSAITDLLLSSREPGIYKITDVDGTKRYSFMEFVDGIPVEIPDELKSLADENSLLLTLMSKSNNEISPDDEISFGFIIKLRTPNLINETVMALQNWENAMKQALTDFLQFEQTQAASVEFLDNTYKETAIRYMNFPDPDLTIDYSVIQAKNGESYLVIVNSREHIYGIIDKLK